jgi:hypothetical protein
VGGTISIELAVEVRDTPGVTKYAVEQLGFQELHIVIHQGFAHMDGKLDDLSGQIEGLSDQINQVVSLHCSFFNRIAERNATAEERS